MNPSLMAAAVFVVLLIPAFYYIALPLILWIDYSRSTGDVVHIMDQPEKLPSEAREILRANYQAFTELGFQYLGTLQLNNESQIRTIAAAFVDPEEMIAGVCSVQLQHAGEQWKCGFHSSGFETDFQDRSRITTTNNMQGVLPVPFCEYGLFPGTALPELLEIHRVLVKDRTGNRLKILSCHSQDPATLIACCKKDLQIEDTFMFDRGYLQVAGKTAVIHGGSGAESETTRYRLTFKAIVFLVWRFLWPMKQMLLKRLARQSRARLAEAIAAQRRNY